METPKYNGRLKAGMTSYNAKGQRIGRRDVPVFVE